MSDPNVDAITDLISESVRLYEGRAPKNAELPYAVLYVGTGRASRTTLAAVSDRRDFPFTVMSVGLDADGVRSVAARVKAALLDQRPAVAGRQTGPITQELAEPLRLDRDVTPHLLYLVDGYSFATVPAPA